MKLHKGQRLESGFTVLDIVDLAEMKAAGVWAQHDCGAQVFHVVNDDSENLCAFAFATTSRDSTGAAHILEHSVLCGSQRYPLKEAFLVLAQGSLQTFLNAWTFPDKTVYPASSVNEHDYFNLMSVYGDAVFRPLLSEWTFMQEGHRYAFDSDGRLSITGVVYNEMKGVYSSLDTYAHRWSVRAVLPDTPYSLESGGNPDHIPQLSYEGLKEFHRQCYSPANCRIFLAGNIPTEKQLTFLNDRFFSSIQSDAVSALLPIPRQVRWSAPKEYRIPCPAGGDTKSTVFISWLLCHATDSSECIALAALTEILLGHDGSPLMKALVESGLGEDISPVSGFESEIAETLFVVGLRGVSDEKQVEALILNELKRLADEGIPKEEIEAALLYIEFSQREIKRSGGPFSLVWMRRCLRTWLHGCKPWESMLIGPALQELKQRIKENSRYFESLIQHYLVGNPHRATVIVEPQEDFLSRKEAEHAQAMEKIRQEHSTQERQSIIDANAALEKIQGQADSPEALASIPHLSRSDLCPDPVLVKRRIEDLDGVPVLCNELYTNSISYCNLAFPLDMLSPQDYPWLPFFARAALAVGLPGMNYAEVSSLLARTVGGFTALLHTGSPVPSPDNPMISTPLGELDLAGRDWIFYRLKCLDDMAPPALELALRLISEADFSDTRRIRDLVLEMKNELRSSLAPMGHAYASGRAARFASPSTHTGETWSGITQLEFVHHLAALDTGEVAARLTQLRDAIISGGIIACLTGSAGALAANGRLFARHFSRFGSPRGRKDPRTFGSQVGVIEPFVCRQGDSREVFGSPSLQVGFAAMSLRGSAFDTVAQAAESVWAHQLSTGALWEAIRMKGGAYGASASSDGMERCFSFSTYRDPAPLRSLDTFTSILGSPQRDDGDLEKTIIGRYARETRPRTPSEHGFADFLRFLSRIDDDCRRRKLERIITMSAGDITAVRRELAQQTSSAAVVIAGMKDAEQAAKALGVEVQALPV